MHQPITSELRRQLAEIDWEFFCKYYLEPHFTKPFADMHWEMAEDFAELLERDEPSHEVVAFPREFGKTTWVSLALPLYCILFEKRRFIILLAQGHDQSKDYLSDIRTELEENERILEDFGDLQGTPWQATEIRTSTGIRVKPLGARMKLRGRKERWQRPDLIVADDLEDTVAAENEAERKARKAWINRVVLKAGTDNTVFFFVGNKIHNDGVIAMLLKNPLFIKREYKAVISWATRQDLWEEWRRVLVSYPDEADRGKIEAKRFYQRHKREMDEGAMSSWEAGRSYYDLMVMLAVGGRVAFFSELQNEPMTEESGIFNFGEYRILSADDGEDAALIPLDGGPAVRLSACTIYGSVDPSLGKKTSDPSAIIIMARAPTGQFFVLVADKRRRSPYQTIKDILRYHRKYRITRFAIETVQFQALFATDAARESMKTGAYINFVQVTPKNNKRLRIIGLEPAVTSGYVLLPEFGCDELKTEALNWPNITHEDALDALELCYSVAIGHEIDPSAQVVEGESLLAGDGQLLAPINDPFFLEAESLAHQRDVVLAIEAGREPPKELWIPIMR